MIELMNIAGSFSFTLNKGFSMGRIAYSPEEFGNADLTIAGEAFSIRLERDRGQTFANIGNKFLGWYKLEYVLEFSDSSITQQQLGAPPDVTLLADLLQNRWDKVVELFNDPKKVLRLHTFTEQKTADFVRGIFGKPKPHHTDSSGTTA